MVIGISDTAESSWQPITTGHECDAAAIYIKYY